MQHGVRVHLDPRGGNQLNVREALRLLNPPDTPASDSEASSSASSASAEPRRSALDDYDYDDDFIDDGDLLHDEEVPPTPTSSLDASDPQMSDGEPNIGYSDDEEDDNPDGNDDEDDAQGQPRSKSKPLSPHYQNRNVVTHGFTTFYVSRGPLPAKSAVDTVATVPPPASRLGNVVIDFPPHARKRFEQQFTNTSAQSEDCPPSPEPSPGDSSFRLPSPPNANSTLSATNADANGSVPKTEKDTQAPLRLTHPSPLGAADDATALAVVNTTANPVMDVVPQSRKVSLSPLPSSSNSNPINGPNAVSGTSAAATAPKSGGKRQPVPIFSPPVAAAIAKLQSLCIERFGDKKPKLDDLPLQQQLNHLFRVLIDAGSAKLHSEIKKDKRLVALDDNVWTALSSFLRTKRASLEAMGHALIWSDREKTAMGAVDAAENAILSFASEHQRLVPAETVTIECTGPIVDLIYKWYIAKTELLDAKNQLASRFKTAKKSLPAWVSSLKKQVLAKCSTTEADILSMIRLMEDRKAAQRRENVERKRKRGSNASASNSETSLRVSSVDINQNFGNATKKAAVENHSSGGDKPLSSKAFVRKASTKKVVKKVPALQPTPDNKGTKSSPEEFIVPQALKPSPQGATSKPVSKASTSKSVTTKAVISPSISSSQKPPTTSTSCTKALPPRSVPKVAGKVPTKAQPKPAQKSGGRLAAKVNTKSNSGLKPEKAQSSSPSTKSFTSGGVGHGGAPKTVSKTVKRKTPPAPHGAADDLTLMKAASKKLAASTIVATNGYTFNALRVDSTINSVAVENGAKKGQPSYIKENSTRSSLGRKILPYTNKTQTVTSREKGISTISPDPPESALLASDPVPVPRSSHNPAQTPGANESTQTSSPVHTHPSQTG